MNTKEVAQRRNSAEKDPVLRAQVWVWVSIHILFQPKLPCCGADNYELLVSFL